MELIETTLVKSILFRYMLIQTLSGMKGSFMLSVKKKFAKEMRAMNKLPVQLCLAYLKKHILRTVTVLI